MHASMLGIWERIKPDVAQVWFYFFPLMQNRCKIEISHLLFQCCSLLLLAVTAAVTRCTPEKCTFDRWNVSFFGTFTWPNLSARWWPWQHRASQGPCGGNLSRCRERAGSMLSIIRFWYLRLEDFEKLFRSPLIQISGSLWQWPFNIF